MEYAELQMLLLAVFFPIPGVIYSFPSCKNNLFIPFLRPACDGSHFPRSLWFYHSCLPTFVLCFSYRVFLLQKAAKQFSPAAEKWWSVQKSLCVELIAKLPIISGKAVQCPNLSWVIWELVHFSGCFQPVEMDDCMLCAPTSTHLLHLTPPQSLQAVPAQPICSGGCRVLAATRLLPSARRWANNALVPKQTKDGWPEKCTLHSKCSEAQGYGIKEWWKYL